MGNRNPTVANCDLSKLELKFESNFHGLFLESVGIDFQSFTPQLWRPSWELTTNISPQGIFGRWFSFSGGSDMWGSFQEGYGFESKAKAFWMKYLQMLLALWTSRFHSVPFQRFFCRSKSWYFGFRGTCISVNTHIYIYCFRFLNTNTDIYIYIHTYSYLYHM